MEKTQLFLPIRSDQYKAGPFEVNLTTMAIIIIGINSNADRNRAKQMSKQRFMITFIVVQQLKKISISIQMARPFDLPVIHELLFLAVLRNTLKIPQGIIVAEYPSKR